MSPNWSRSQPDKYDFAYCAVGDAGENRTVGSNLKLKYFIQAVNFQWPSQKLPWPLRSLLWPANGPCGPCWEPLLWSVQMRQDSVGGLVTKLQAGQPRNHVWLMAGARDFCLLQSVWTGTCWSWTWVMWLWRHFGAAWWLNIVYVGVFS